MRRFLIRVAGLQNMRYNKRGKEQERIAELAQEYYNKRGKEGRILDIPAMHYRYSLRMSLGCLEINACICFAISVMLYSGP